MLSKLKYLNINFNETAMIHINYFENIYFYILFQINVKISLSMFL